MTKLTLMLDFDESNNLEYLAESIRYAEHLREIHIVDTSGLESPTNFMLLDQPIHFMAVIQQLRYLFNVVFVVKAGL